MGIKKKLIGYSKLLLLLLFMLLFVSSYTTCKAVTLSDYELTDEIMQDVVDDLGLGFYYSGDLIPNLTNNFNTIMRTVRARGQYHQVTLADVMILGNYTSTNNSGGKDLQLIFLSYRDTDSSAVSETIYPYVAFNGNSNGQYINGSKQFYVFNGWTYDSNNNISGVSTTSSFPIWRFSNTSITNPTTTLTVYQPTVYVADTAVGMDKALIFYNSSLDGPHEVEIFSRTTSNGYGLYDWAYRKIYLDDYGTTPIPTPTPTPTGSGGGGSTDLTQTNGLIQDIQDSLTTEFDPDNIEVSSGDIISSLGFDLMTDRFSNFWLTLTQNLTDALSSNVRTFTFISPFNGSTIVIDLDDFPIVMPTSIRWLITMITSFGIVIIIVRYSHDIYVKVTSGNVDEVLAMNEDSGIIDLF